MEATPGRQSGFADTLQAQRHERKRKQDRSRDADNLDVRVEPGYTAAMTAQMTRKGD